MAPVEANYFEPSLGSLASAVDQHSSDGILRQPSTHDSVTAPGGEKVHRAHGAKGIGLAEKRGKAT